MDDETNLSEVDARVRAALSAGPDATHRVLAAALADRSRRFARRRYAIATAAVVVSGLAVGTWRWPGTAPSPWATTSLKVTNRGSLIVVESADGRRWIVGPAPARRTGGNYVIVIPQ